MLYVLIVFFAQKYTEELLVWRLYTIMTVQLKTISNIPFGRFIKNLLTNHAWLHLIFLLCFFVRVHLNFNATNQNEYINFQILNTLKVCDTLFIRVFQYLKKMFRGQQKSAFQLLTLIKGHYSCASELLNSWKFSGNIKHQ